MPEVCRPTADAWLLRHFVYLSFGFWTGPTRRKAALFVLGLFGCLVLNLIPAIAVNRWNKFFFDALQSKDQHLILLSIGLMLALALLSAMTSVALLQMRMNFQLRWREWLTRTLVRRWMERRRFYQLSVLRLVDNPEARIAEDGRIAIELFVDFATGVTNALLMAASFVSVLWFIGGSLTLWGMTIPGYLVIAVVIYSACTSYGMLLLGGPLVARAEAKAMAEADFRFELSHTRENAETIALIGGDDAERELHYNRFDQVATRWIAVIGRQARMLFLSSGNNVLAPVIPLMLGAPKYLAGELSLGDLMQAAAAFIQVQLALNWLADNSMRLADWFASARRVAALDLFFDNLDKLAISAEDKRIDLAFSDDSALHLCGLSIAQHDGTQMLADTDAVIRSGERILVKGESGAGKSTLIRAMAGLWPWGSGRILRPKDARIAFMPQQPYMPRGTLRDALDYPHDDTLPDAARIETILVACGLGHLVSRLDEEQSWSDVLSGGEQQQLGFARVLLRPPDIIIMDEPTSALDDLSQTRLMELLSEEAPRSTIIHAARRNVDKRFYDREIQLKSRPAERVREAAKGREAALSKASTILRESLPN
ncbi:ABC transporter ATP-binding protein/permease [Methylocystis parvus]|uniref:ABC transporter ATP-binding protein/permease n=1 Tax=Methylocystis parvus TaxID=134 RepID=A0A6B8M4J7_9HYPH|nr:ABC transporter ATP-binding protein/permease [Methylocystis parvus]QGM97296.1 ABC transporter ATP-binding protein/permease [Methylocystis parvus]